MFSKSVYKLSTTITIIKVFIIVMAFSNFSVNASECGIMLYQKDKSRGVDVLDNSCQSANEIALGTVFELISGGRLWLKSLSAPDSDSDFQVICQSRSASSIQVSVSNIFLPWINPKGLKNCSSWVDHHMSCDDVNGSKNSFFCAIALIKRPEFDSAKDIQRTTSIKLRNIKQLKSGAVSVEEVLESMNQETRLCRNLYKADQPVKVSWIINKTGTAKNIELKSNKNSDGRQFVDCVLDVVKNFPYPAYSNEVSVAHQF